MNEKKKTKIIKKRERNTKEDKDQCQWWWWWWWWRWWEWKGLWKKITQLFGDQRTKKKKNQNGLPGKRERRTHSIIEEESFSLFCNDIWNNGIFFRIEPYDSFVWARLFSTFFFLKVFFSLKVFQVKTSSSSSEMIVLLQGLRLA